MKKKLLTIMALLCAFGSAQADDNQQTEYLWDFTTFLSEDTANVSYDIKTNTTSSKWKYKENNKGDTTCYCNAASVGSIEESKDTTYGTLSVNSNELRVTKGLKFYIPKSEGLKIYLDGHMNLGDGCTIKTPSLKKGQIVVIDCKSGKSDSKRIITCSNLTTFKDTTYAQSADRMIYMGYVASDGAVTISTASSEGAMNFYTIRVMANSKIKNELEISSVNITLNNYGVRTYSSNLPLDFSSSKLSAYVVSAYTGSGSNGKITLASVGKVPPYTGVILLWDTTSVKDSYATVSFCVPSAVETNYLLPSVGETSVAASTSSAFNYVFGGKKENEKMTNIGFYYIEKNSFTSGANMAYLSIPRELAKASSASTAKFITLDLSDGEGETTGISNVKATNMDDDAYYTLSGVRVMQPRKGLYIKNGKKVIIK